MAAAARARGLSFESTRGQLAPGASEAAARTARHTWLEQVRIKHGSAAILTAHHQDDLLETSLLNLARGTGRRGLAPMQPQASPTILRPFIALTRADLRAYARQRNIIWREDSTNADTTNPRNFLRHHLLPAAGPNWRRSYLELINQLAALNTTIDQVIAAMLESARTSPDTYTFPPAVIRGLSLPEVEELLLVAARTLRPGIQLDRPLMQEIAQFAHTGHSRKYRPLRQGLFLALARDQISLTTKAPR